MFSESSIFDKRVNEIMEENSSKGVPAIIEIEAGTGKYKIDFSQ